LRYGQDYFRNLQLQNQPALQIVLTEVEYYQYEQFTLDNFRSDSFSGFVGDFCF